MPVLRETRQGCVQDIEREFVDTGKIQYVSLNFPLKRIHPLAMKAAQAAECAGRDGKFWQMRELLFLNQRMLIEAELRKHAAALKLDAEEFERRLRNDSTKSMMRADATLAERLGVRGTRPSSSAKSVTERSIR
jgi:protein-disulfide isomerase